jgi:hypothetical protein
MCLTGQLHAHCNASAGLPTHPPSIANLINQRTTPSHRLPYLDNTLICTSFYAGGTDSDSDSDSGSDSGDDARGEGGGKRARHDGAVESTKKHSLPSALDLLSGKTPDSNAAFLMAGAGIYEVPCMLPRSHACSHGASARVCV